MLLCGLTVIDWFIKEKITTTFVRLSRWGFNKLWTAVIEMSIVMCHIQQLFLRCYRTYCFSTIVLPLTLECVLIISLYVHALKQEMATQCHQAKVVENNKFDFSGNRRARFKKSICSLFFLFKNSICSLLFLLSKRRK